MIQVLNLGSSSRSLSVHARMNGMYSAGFIFRRIGLADLLNPDPTQEKLAAISQQLAQVSAQIVTVQASSQLTDGFRTSVFCSRIVLENATQSSGAVLSSGASRSWRASTPGSATPSRS